MNPHRVLKCDCESRSAHYTSTMNQAPQCARSPVPASAVPQLLPIARRVFWWGKPEAWLEDSIRFAAQVMTYADLDDLRVVASLLGEDIFREVLRSPPAGVFDIKSWTFWHLRYGLEVPPFPVRMFESDAQSEA